MTLSLRKKNSNTMKTDFDYLDSLREEISHGYHEANQIVAQAKLNYTYLKAPNGRHTKLRHEDWILVRTKSFKEKFGDWEMAYRKHFLLYHEAVKQLSGNEFEKQAGKTLTEQVSKYFASIGGLAHSPLFGDVVLDRKGAEDSLAHGMGRKKAIAYAAVKEVIEQGILIAYDVNHKKRGYDSAIIAAPIRIAESDFVCEVVVTRLDDNRFYLHEVTQKNKLQDAVFLTNLGRSPSAHLGVAAKVLQDIVCASDLPEIFFDENGEPRLEGFE